jgi:hypothetical protein
MMSLIKQAIIERLNELGTNMSQRIDKVKKKKINKDSANKDVKSIFMNVTDDLE